MSLKKKKKNKSFSLIVWLKKKLNAVPVPGSSLLDALLLSWSTGDALEKQATVTAKSCPCPLSCLLILLPTVPPLLLLAQVLCGHRRQIRGPTALKLRRWLVFCHIRSPVLFTVQSYEYLCWWKGGGDAKMAVSYQVFTGQNFFIFITMLA